MEKILFTAAEQEELECAIRAYNLFKKDNPNNNNLDVTFMLTGIGATSTCYRVTKEIVSAKLNNAPYTLLINIGIAGSYDMERFPIGSCAIINKESFGDLGFETLFGFQTLFEYQALDADAIPFKGGALYYNPIENSPISTLLNSLPKASAVTVQTVTGDTNKVENLKKQFNAEIESMEGAAFFYVALLEGVPFFELRSVSNRVGERDKANWDIPFALKTLKEKCADIFNAYL